MQMEFFTDAVLFDTSQDTKKCNKCNEVLPIACFSRHSGANYHRPECKKCNNELSKVRTDLRYKHGMPDEDYKCPICLSDADEVKGKGNAKNGAWVVDHCHITDKFRGWLCHKCNRGLGNFDDNIDILKRVINYIQNHKEK